MSTERDFKYYVTFYNNGDKKEEKWLRRCENVENVKHKCNITYLDGIAYELYREDYENPSLIRYLPDGYVYDTFYMENGEPHKEGGPAIVRSLPNSEILVERYFIDGKQVKEDVYSHNSLE